MLLKVSHCCLLGHMVLRQTPHCHLLTQWHAFPVLPTASHPYPFTQGQSPLSHGTHGFKIPCCHLLTWWCPCCFSPKNTVLYDVCHLLYHFEFWCDSGHISLCSQVDLTCDKPILCSQMTPKKQFYVKLDTGESQKRFADQDFV